VQWKLVWFFVCRFSISVPFDVGERGKYLIFSSLLSPLWEGREASRNLHKSRKNIKIWQFSRKNNRIWQFSRFLEVSRPFSNPHRAQKTDRTPWSLKLISITKNPAKTIDSWFFVYLFLFQRSAKWILILEVLKENPLGKPEGSSGSSPLCQKHSSQPGDGPWPPGFTEGWVFTQWKIMDLFDRKIKSIKI
jgi:hypothetical protein